MSGNVSLQGSNISLDSFKLIRQSGLDSSAIISRSCIQDIFLYLNFSFEVSHDNSIQVGFLTTVSLQNGVDETIQSTLNGLQVFQQSSLL